MIVTPALNYRDEVVQLLTEAKLPYNDLPARLHNFFVMLANDVVIAVAGLEIYGNSGLLRSVAVKSDYRKQGIATQLIEKIINSATEKQLLRLYLLTETAENYFLNKGFAVISRDEVPGPVKRSSEFETVCPVSAVVMFKKLNNK